MKLTKRAKVTEAQVQSWITTAVKEAKVSKSRTLSEELALAEHTANKLEKKAAISIDNAAKQAALAEVKKLREMINTAKLKMRISKSNSILNKAGKALIMNSREATVGKFAETAFPTRTVKRTVMRENRLGELVPKTHMGKAVHKKVTQKMYSDVTEEVVDGKKIISVPKNYTERVNRQMAINNNKRQLQSKTSMVEKKIGRSKITVFE